MSVSPSHEELVQKISYLESKNRKLSIFATSFQTANYGMAFTTLDGQFVDVNDAFCDGLGYSREELLQMQAIDLKPIALQDKFQQGFALLKEKGSILLETIYLHKNGTSIHVELSASIVSKESESFIYIVAHNINKRIKREDTLRRFERIFSLSQDLIAYVDSDYTYQMINEQFCHDNDKHVEQIVGCSCAEVLGKDVFTQIIKSQVDRCLAGEIVRYQAWFEYTTIGRRFRDVTYYPDQIADGSIKGVYAIIHDLTDFKLAQEAKASEQAMLSHVLDSTGNEVYLINKDHDILYVNSHIEKIRGPVENRKCYDYIASRKKVCPWCKDSLVFSGHKPVRWLKKGEKDGRTYDVFENMITSPEYGTAKIVFYNDITREKNTQDELSSNKNILHSIFDNATSLIYVKDRKGRYLYVNKYFQNVFASRKEILGKTDFDIYTEKYALQFSKNDAKVFATEEVTSFEERLLVDGVERFYLSVKFPIKDYKGIVESVGGITTDITEQKKIELELETKHEQLLSLINATPDTICFKDGAGRWLLANDAIIQLFHLEDVNYVGKTDVELAKYDDFYRDAFLACQDSDEVAWQQKTQSRVTEHISLPDNSTKNYDVIKVPLFYPNGLRQGLVVIGRDVTESVKNSKEIQKKNKTIQDANIALRVLVDQQKIACEQIEQDLLTTLRRSVLPYMKLLSETDLDDTGQELLELVTAHLQTITTSFVKKLDDSSIGLSPKELLVADLVKQGKSSLEISKLLGLTQRTVEVYRNIIRKKINISGKKINLCSYLNDIFS